MEFDSFSVIEAALVNLAFARAELTYAGENHHAWIRRALDHIEAAIADLAALAPNFGALKGSGDDDDAG